MQATERTEIVASLRTWSETFRRVNSPAVSDLLTLAATMIEKGSASPDVALELMVCAAARDHLPEQRSAAALMRRAADHILP